MDKVTPSVNRVAIYQQTPEQLIGTLKSLQNEWSVFNDPKIVEGSKVHRTSGARSLMRWAGGYAEAKYQIAWTKTAQWTSGCNTVEGAGNLLDDLSQLIQDTEAVCERVLDLVKEFSSESKEFSSDAEVKEIGFAVVSEIPPDTLALLKEISLKTFEVFSQSREKLKVLKATFDKEEPSAVRTHYVLSYAEIIEQADQGCARIMKNFFEKQSEGHVQGEFEFAKQVSGFEEYVATAQATQTPLTEAQLKTALYPLKEFIRVLDVNCQSLAEIYAKMSGKKDVSLDVKEQLEIDHCKAVLDSMRSFVKQFHACVDAPFAAMQKEPTQAHVAAFSAALKEAFQSKQGLAFIADLTKVTSLNTSKRFGQLQALLLEHYPGWGSLSAYPCWQAIVFQIATSRLWMPCNEYMKTLCALKVSPEVISPLIDLYKQLLAIAHISQTFNPEKRQ